MPNRFIEGVANHSRGNMRALIDTGISYADNINEAIEVLNKVCAEFETDERFKEAPQTIGVQSFDSHEVSFFASSTKRKVAYNRHVSGMFASASKKLLTRHASKCHRHVISLLSKSKCFMIDMSKSMSRNIQFADFFMS